MVRWSEAAVHLAARRRLARQGAETRRRAFGRLRQLASAALAKLAAERIENIANALLVRL
jgi:hypothetical protein